MKYDNSGILGKNLRKTSDSHPEYTGSITVDGKEYWLNGWAKDGAKGKFFSLALKPKEEIKQQTKPEPKQMVDADVPF